MLTLVNPYCKIKTLKIINKKKFSLFGMFWIVTDFVEDVCLKSISNLADITQTETVLVWKREIIHFLDLRRE